MKKQIKIKTYNFLDQSSAVNFEETQEKTEYSGKNPFFEKPTTTELVEKDYYKQEARKEYWPFLEPL